jgi:hypothetical protein
MANRRQMPGDKQIQRTFDNMSTERKVEQAGQGVSSILKGAYWLLICNAECLSAEKRRLFILNFCSQPAIAGLDRCRQVHHGKSALTARMPMKINDEELKLYNLFLCC